VTETETFMAYSHGLMSQIQHWLDAGVIPFPKLGERIVELGDQALNADTPDDAVISFIRKFKPDFDRKEIAGGLPANSFGVVYACEMWRRCGLEYLSYDVTDAPYSKVFDLNFHSVPSEDRQSAVIVTNIGTTEHIANQLNAFRTAHDLLKVGGVAIHSVPFTGMLNHGLINYHPKFFVSLIVNNRYRLRAAQLSEPVDHASYGVGNTVYDGDFIRGDAKLPGSEFWSATPLYAGMIDLVIERIFPDEFVPPVDFAKGYFDDMPMGDLSLLTGTDKLPHNAWADAYRRSTTPSQATEFVSHKVKR
jgi:hypothetical protein